MKSSAVEIPASVPIARPIPRIAECEVEVRVVDLRPGVWIRTWIYFRKLIRRRQETAAIAEARKIADARVLDARIASTKAAREFREQRQRLELKNAELQQKLADCEYRLKELRDVDLPKRNNEIAVLKHEKELLEALHTKALSKIESDIAVYDVKVTEATTAEYHLRRRE